MVNFIIFILSKLHLGIFAEFEMMTKAKNERILYVMTHTQKGFWDEVEFRAKLHFTLYGINQNKTLNKL